MKRCLVAASLLALLSAPATGLRAQSRGAYGVWASDARYDLKVFPYKGMVVDVKWSEVEPAEGVFDWRSVDAGLETAASLGLYSCVGVNVGPMSPTWLYEKGIPKIMTEGHQRSGPYPYYLDRRYVSYYHRLIEEFGRHIRSAPPRLTERLLYVLVKTGSTQDEAPYKGTPSPARYAITEAEWHGFRLAAVEKFDGAFQEGPGPVIPMLFNGLMSWDDPAIQEWVRANVTGGWGHKQACHYYQLNDEAESAREFLPHLIDPAPDDFEFFTRCEMDQTWNKKIFQPNVRMSFYWTALCALHRGQSVWHLTGSAREWCRENDYWDFACFFQKYAGQTRSPTALGAFCALREGLDAADTEKFPESKYGKAVRDNRDRYVAICAADAARGAKMDCVEGVLRAQTTQRNVQDGLNDAGWAIFPGNFERFLTQIDPDGTSVGWWRVGGEVTASTPVYARFARGFDHASGRDAMFFDIKDSFFSATPLEEDGQGGARAVTIRVVYYDQGTGQWSLWYDALDEAPKRACLVTKTNSGTWKEQTVTLRDARLDNRCPRGADLMLVNTDAEDDIFHMIELTRSHAPNGPGSRRVSSP